MEERKTTNIQKTSSGNKAVIVLLILLLAGSLIGNFYLYKQRGGKETVIQEKEVVIDSLIDAKSSVQSELNTVRMELESYRGKNAELDSLINDYSEKVKKLEADLKKSGNKSKSYEKQIAELRKQLQEVQEIRDQFQDDIDRLTQENTELKGQLTMANTRSDSLQGELKTAGTLAVEYVKVKSYRVKTNGKPVETGKASRTEKMEVCFSVMDNKVAETGEKTAFVRIMQPDGSVLDEKGKFMVKDLGIESGYTRTETFNYDRGKKDFCMDFTDEKYHFQKGTYKIDIFLDGMLVQSGFYDLK